MEFTVLLPSLAALCRSGRYMGKFNRATITETVAQILINTLRGRDESEISHKL